MTKADIVREIATQTGLEKQVVLQVVEGFMDSVKSSPSQSKLRPTALCQPRSSRCLACSPQQRSLAEIEQPDVTTKPLLMSKSD